MADIDIYSQLSHLKQVDYHNTLAIASLIEILVEKGIINKEDISAKARELEIETIGNISKELMK